MEEQLEKIFYSTGALQHYTGYPYLIRAIILAAEDPKRLHNMGEGIYRPIAEEYHTSFSNVHKNIRTVRDAFVANGGNKVLAELTGCKAWEDHNPYPKELIEILAHVLRKS